MSDRVDAVLLTLRARFAPDAATGELVDFLAAQGFDRGQIGEIVARFRAEAADRATATRADAGTAGGGSGDGSPPAAPGPPPVRVPGPHEWGRFAPEAWGRVLRLAATGLLPPADLERLIDRAMEQGEGRVDLAALRAALESVGLGDVGGDTEPTTIH